MKPLKLFFTIIPFLNIWVTGHGQDRDRNVSFVLQLPIQCDFQKAEILIGPYQVQKNTQINFGIRTVVMLQTTKNIRLFIGAGYYRERFGIKRPYNHQALNPGIDSIPSSTKTFNYDYHQLVIPVGMEWRVPNSKVSIGVEYSPGIRFLSRYNGSLPFPGANIEDHSLSFFSHNINLLIVFAISNQFSFSPYIRMFHNYRKDAIFFESRSETVSRYVDGLGISLSYKLNL